MNKLYELVKLFEKELQCNCDLDSWEPEKDTSHSWVCRIHKKAYRVLRSKNEGKKFEAEAKRLGLGPEDMDQEPPVFGGE